ncbi:MAG: hypothetical protein IPM89_06605 [Candidatus Competibacteraceae bacterium]|nr:MAG: hypothetical protein IPM89_06605 [Candidatus Competibacteraceae bacterium]
MPTFIKKLIAILAGLIALIFSIVLTAREVQSIDEVANQQIKPDWSQLPIFAMRGGLEVFWNVLDRTNGENETQAFAHGFKPITLINPYADYPGKQQENIAHYLDKGNKNPWVKPSFFERIIKRNITAQRSCGIYVHDIEFEFQEDAAKAWADPSIRAASKAETLHHFEETYFQEWAEWFWLPLKWTKEIDPDSRVGLYGVQPFRRDYWGIAGKTAQQIDGTHHSDWKLWQYIDRYVDFYIASIYAFYDSPETIFYMAANVEENYLRTRRLGDKPLFAYESLQFQKDGHRELEPYLAEAMAILPFFSGAKGIVLFGYEPQLKPGDGPPYARLSLFMQSLNRVANLSDKIGKARLVIDEPAHVLWKEKRPLIRQLIVNDGECIVMAINPWQEETAETNTPVRCGNTTFQVTMRGRHTTLTEIGEMAKILQPQHKEPSSS